MGSVRKYEPKRYVFDLLELNHRHDEAGRHCYDQILCWSWSPDYRRHDIEAWWLVTKNTPRRQGDQWIVEHTPHNQPTIKVVGKAYRETWTTNDPERDNKLLKDEKFRRAFR